jgi:molybdopterin-dependent oxidoreductase alpha subunit
MSQEPEIKPYHKPAGGWGALKASLGTVLKEKGGLQTVKALLNMNQPNGFDCPGCAWPDPENHSHLAEYCENGVKAAAAETTGKSVTEDFFKINSIEELSNQTDYWLESQGRLTSPMMIQKGDSHYSPISWEKAFATIGQQLRNLKKPDEALFYTSGRASNEAAFLYQLFGRMFGTNNFPDCSNLCHESSGVALNESIGIGKGTVSLYDFDLADAIFVIGQNPGTNHPRMLAELQKAARRGAQVISINPLFEKGLVEFTHPKEFLPMLTLSKTKISSSYFQIKVGGDLAALKGIIKILLERDHLAKDTFLDHKFIEDHTSNFETFKKDIESENLDRLCKLSGLSKEQLEELATIYQKANKVIICWAMGITQTRHAVGTIQYIVNLLLLRGNIGREGAGVCPVRGHSNVQGDRTVGITEKPSEKFLKNLGEVFHFTPPTHHGHDAVDSINAMAKGECKFFMSLGGNFAKASPHTSFTEKALELCQLTVHISTKLNRSHIKHGKVGIILPCLGRSEVDMQKTGNQIITVEDSMSMVHASIGKNKPHAPLLKSEVAIVAGIALATLAPNPNVNWQAMVDDYSLIRKKISQVIDGFDGYNEKIKKPGGFLLRNSASHREWKNKTGKANFAIYEVEDLSLPKGQLILMTIRSHDQYNTTIYGMDDRYRGVYNTRKVIFLNKSDIKELGFQDGEMVDLQSCYQGEEKRKVEGFRIVSYNIPIGCAATYFPEANELVSTNITAKRSNTPLSKYIPIELISTKRNT